MNTINYIVMQVQASAEGNVHISVPFSPQFASLVQSIHMILREVGLKGKSTNYDKPQIWRDSFWTNITAARLLIAVCTPDKRGSVNSNVIYEIGVAHALGKPSIILTTEPDTLPFQLSWYHHIRYSEEEVGTAELHDRILSAIREISAKEDTKYFHFDSTIYASTAPDWVILKPDMWRRFVASLSALLDIQKKVLLLQSSTAPLAVSFSSQVVGRTFDDVRQDTTRHIDHIEMLRIDLALAGLRDVVAERRSILEVFEQLSSDANLKTYAIAATGKQLYIRILQVLSDAVSQYDELLGEIQYVSSTEEGIRDHQIILYGQIKYCQALMQEASTATGELLRNMIRMLTENVD